ncbi:hypothetical protein Dda_3956 [Drechslerella dactyloides]|uniref:Pentatricopeptide repeat protein n=1 Tax=Drechslerella dactyloides TaxID=74499 RepID=A0AAD6IZQ4_DREDA|nr:hypothetical protein Dda_3956 [Drechslerella dactyloides]
MLVRTAYRSGRCAAFNAACYGRAAAGTLRCVPHRYASTLIALTSQAGQYNTRGLSRPVVPYAFQRWIDRKQDFSVSLVRPKDEPARREEEEEEEEDEEMMEEEEDDDDYVDPRSTNPFENSREDLDDTMLEYWRRMGGNPRELKNMFNQFDEALEKKDEIEPEATKDGYGVYEDVDEEMDEWEQDPDQEPAYKTVYLPNKQLDDMMKSGFLKDVSEIDPLAEKEMPKEVEALHHHDQLFLKKFFMRAQFARAHPSPATHKVVWRLFRIVYKKTNLAELFNEHAWNLLWSLDKDMIPKPHKMWLGDLMIHVNAPMKEEQWISYMEALFWHGRRDRAFQCWQLGLQDNPSLTWWSVGARLHATENQPEAAKEIIDHVINTKGTAIPKLFIPAIVCYHTLSEASHIQNLQQREKRYNDEAVKLYNKMRQHCPVIEQKEYSRVALSFLDAGYFKHAMMVYEHMLAAYPTLIDESSNFAYWEWKFKEAAIKAQNEAHDEEELQDLTVNALRLLPQKQKTRILLGNFMRNLIRRNRIEDALRVAKTMQDLGMQMDTTTYNLLLILFDEHGKIGKFEVLAARMIRRLLEPMFQQNATYQQVLNAPEFKPKEPEELVLPDRHSFNRNVPAIRSAVQLPEHVETILARFEGAGDVQLPVVNEMRPERLTQLSESLFEGLVKYDDLIPPADSSTFGLLLRRSTKSSNMLKATSVLQLLAESKINPSSVLINPLLAMLARKKKYAELFASRAVLTDPNGFNIKLNERAWALLWLSLYKSLSGGKPMDGVPTPRELFKEMVERNDIVPDNSVYHYVLRCFWRSEDIVGAYTAMHGMALVWELSPHRTSVEITIAGLARLLSRGGSRFQRRHTYWYLKHLARKMFGKMIPERGPRKRQRIMVEIGRLTRKKLRIRKAYKQGKGDLEKHLRDLRKTSEKIDKLHFYLKVNEKELQEYWTQPPAVFKLPRNKVAQAALSAALPIDLDKGSDEQEMPDETMEKLSHYMRNIVFRGPWPQEWLDGVVVARGDMGLIDEEAIERRKMDLFDD